MMVSSLEVEPISLRARLVRRFYEPLILLKALDPIRGERTKPEYCSDTSDLSDQKSRRSFADGIAYICSYQKGPDHVTAAALERSPQETVVWLAANANVEDDVIYFLEGVLESLGCIAAQAKKEEREKMGREKYDELLNTIIAFNKPRLESYITTVRKLNTECLKIIRSTIKLIGELSCSIDSNIVSKKADPT
jgi:hypothetical protein